jgi:uroporphyrinogen decarboxylase
MTSRERMLTAMTGGVPDRVPAAPDTNWMIPARRIGGPFWDVYYHGKPPIWKAYNDCVRYFGVDGFSHHGTYHVPHRPGAESKTRIVSQTEQQMVTETVFKCPAGELTEETTFLRMEPPTPTKKWITDFEAQYESLRWLFFGDVENIRFDQYHAARNDMGGNGVVGLCMLLPTLLTQWREPTESAFLDYYDHHDLLTAFIEEWTDYLVRIARQIIDRDVRPDFVFFPNSGMVTMQSVEIMREFSLPALKKLTAMFKKAGIVTSLHSCGKERAIVEAAATETDLDCIDPLEIAPMGDCDLAEIKQKFGKRLALKGNLHTTQVMLFGTPEVVEREARKCLDAAMDGGGFILSTGDQCGRDTPEANIFKLVEVCEKYGRY